MKAMGRFTAVFLIVLLVTGLAVASSGCIGGTSTSSEDWLKLVPAGSLGVLYVDSDFFHDSTTTQVIKALGFYEDYSNMLNEIQNQLNVTPSDVDWGMLVVYDYKVSDYSSNGDFAMYFAGRFNVDELTKKFLNETKNVSKTTYQGVKVYVWKDYDGRYYGAVIEKDYVLLGNLEVVRMMIDLKKGNGKWAEDFKGPRDKVGKGYVLGIFNLNASPSLKGSLTRDLSGEGNLSSVASQLSGVGYVAMSYRTDENNVIVNILFTTSDKETAREFAKALDGLRAMATMSGTVKNSTALETFLKDDITIKSEDNDVMINLKTPVDRIRAVVEYLNSTG